MGIMENKMETTIPILGLYRDTVKAHGKYYIIF